jgi:pyruvate ferredoxin oxidoreductase alpha subunit
VVASNVRMALAGRLHLRGHTVIAGLGGRAITRQSLHRVLASAVSGELEKVHFLDLDWDTVNAVLDKEKKDRHSGPMAENVLRTMRLVGAKIL